MRQFSQFFLTSTLIYMGVTSRQFGPACKHFVICLSYLWLGPGDCFVMFLSSLSPCSPLVLSPYVSACLYLQYAPNKPRIRSVAAYIKNHTYLRWGSQEASPWSTSSNLPSYQQYNRKSIFLSFNRSAIQGWFILCLLDVSPKHASANNLQ